MARVLVVEDTEASRYVSTSWLRRAGFEVIEAATGREALERVGPDIDVVVLDVHLPDMSGFDVCTAIKGNSVTASVPVMHVSATAVAVAERTRGLDLGADAYLTEPVEHDEFIALVRSLARTRTARRATDSLVARLTRLAAVTLPLNAADSVPRLLEQAATGAADVFGATALVVAANNLGTVIRVLAESGSTTPTTEPSGEPLSATWGNGPIKILARETPASWQPLLERVALRPAAWFLTPFSDRSTLLRGGLAIALSSETASFSSDDMTLAQQLTAAIGVALSNLRAFAEEHQIALTLQRALLPERLPEAPGLSLAARYIAASDQASIGGDFYDAFLLPTGEVAVVMGDVQGHSLRAATVMAELRYSLRAYMAEGHAPRDALALLDRLLARSHPDSTATVAVLVVDVGEARAVLANAGHLPPLLATSSRVELVGEHGPLLGLGDSSWPAQSLALDDGALVVLVTDGLIERRDVAIDECLAELAAVVSSVRELDEEQVADALLAHFAHRTEDDVAVLVLGYRRVDQPSAMGSSVVWKFR